MKTSSLAPLSAQWRDRQLVALDAGTAQAMLGKNMAYCDHRVNAYTENEDEDVHSSAYLADS